MKELLTEQEKQDRDDGDEPPDPDNRSHCQKQIKKLTKARLIRSRHPRLQKGSLDLISLLRKLLDLLLTLGPGYQGSGGSSPSSGSCFSCSVRSSCHLLLYFFTLLFFSHRLIRSTFLDALLGSLVASRANGASQPSSFISSQMSST